MGRARCGGTLCFLFLVLLVGAANGADSSTSTPVPRSPNPAFLCPNYDGPEDKVGLEEGSQSRISQDTFRYLAGCNSASLKDKHGLTPTRYRMLQQYYIHEINKTVLEETTRKRARRVPLCVHSSKLALYENQIGGFIPIIHALENKEQEYVGKNYYEGDPPIWFPRLEEDKKWSTDTDFGVEDIRLTRIYTGDPKMPLLRQWFHMAFYMREQIWEGIYVQAISAPMGLPFGEFRQDFDCNDPKSPLKDRGGREIFHSPVEEKNSYYKDILVFPCSYRSRYHLRHPNVFTVGGRPGTPKSKYHEFHIHFNWIDSSCYDAIAMQFLIVLVKSFEKQDYHVFYTPALNHTFLDSNDGLPYPLYPGWVEDKTISCNGESIPMYEEVSQEFINTGNIPSPKPPLIKSTASLESAKTDKSNTPGENGVNPEGPERDSYSEFFEKPVRDRNPVDMSESPDRENAHVYLSELNRGEDEASQLERDSDSLSESDNGVKENRDVDSGPDDKYKRRNAYGTPIEVEDDSPNQNIRRRLAESEDDEPVGTLAPITPAPYEIDPQTVESTRNEDEAPNYMEKTKPQKSIRKNPFGMTKTKSHEMRESNSNNWMRKKRAANGYPKIPSKCTDRNSCIMGQFQIVRGDVAILEYNKEFDDCVVTGKGVTPHVPLECPPDAVLCDSYFNAIRKDPNDRKKLRVSTLNSKLCDICTFPDDSELFRSELPPVIPVIGPTKAGFVNENGVFMVRPLPLMSLVDVGFQTEPVFELFPNGTIMPTTTLEPLPPLEPTETTTAMTVPGSNDSEPDGHIPEGKLKYFDRHIIYKNQISKMFHGFLLIYAWFFLVPVANFIARYFKESGGITGNGVCGMPNWLVNHIGLYVYAFICMGIGVLNVGFLVDIDCERLPLQEDKTYCEKNPGVKLFGAHIVFGVLAFFFLLPQHFLGWIRPLSENIRWVIQIIHSCGGYVAYILAIISVFMSQTCVEIYAETALMIGIHVVLFGVGCFLQRVQDKSLNLAVSRKVFPVLEVVEIREDPPQEKAKKILQWIHDISLGVVSLLMMITYNKIARSDPLTNLDHTYDELNSQSQRDLEFDGLILPNSCSRANYVYLFQQMGCDDSENSTKVSFWCNNPKNYTI